MPEDLNNMYLNNSFLWSVQSPSAPSTFHRTIWSQSINDYSPPSGPTIFNSSYIFYLKSLRKTTKFVSKPTWAQLLNSTIEIYCFQGTKKQGFWTKTQIYKPLKETRSVRVARHTNILVLATGLRKLTPCEWVATFLPSDTKWINSTSEINTFSLNYGKDNVFYRVPALSS